eukprot:314005-Heterocapsa_arctica.AAC.1
MNCMCLRRHAIHPVGLVNTGLQVDDQVSGSREGVLAQEQQEGILRAIAQGQEEGVVAEAVLVE